MTAELDPELLALEGETLTVLAPGGLVVVVEALDDDTYAYPKTANLKRGQSIVLTEPVLRASVNRKGTSWLLDSELDQRDKYGHVRFSLDGWPENEPVMVPGSPEALYQADQERALAWRTKAGPELADALRDIDRRLGRGGTKSTILREDRRSTDRAVADALTQRRLVEAEFRAQAEAAGGAA
ncbi:hypothetical protein [Amnibacterium kyonggiense]